MKLFLAEKLETGAKRSGVKGAKSLAGFRGGAPEQVWAAAQNTPQISVVSEQAA